jgi:hypothetical protein
VVLGVPDIGTKTGNVYSAQYRLDEKEVWEKINSPLIWRGVN